MATYVKGNAVANASGYELLEKVGETYNSLATASEINFEVSAMEFAAGDHLLAVKAKGDGVNYTDSDPSDTVTYTVANAPTLVTNSYDASGYYIAIADGTETASASWIRSDFIDITTLANNAEGFCTSNLQGHAKVANVAYYSSNDLDSYLSGVQHTTGEVKQYTLEEIQESAPDNAAYVIFSTHVNNRPLQVTVMQ